MEKEIGWLLQEKYKGKKTARFYADVKRLESGEPLDHIIGFVEFLGCKILVGPDVLIPRFETEDWVSEAVESLKLKAESKKVAVLDMFAGSGAIGIAVLKHVKNAHVTFAESEKEAIVQIRKNCKLNNISPKNYKIIQSDIFSKVNGRFDYILANPPYIPVKNRHKVAKAALKYEPHAALFGGEDGSEFIGRFLASAKKRLNKNGLPAQAGKIYMEFDSPQKPAINTLLKKYDYQNWEFHRDQYGKQRWVMIQ